MTTESQEEIVMSNKKYNVISLFSGAGGLDMGFHNRGFHILWANDCNKDACITYDKWANYVDGQQLPTEERTEIVCDDVKDIDITKIVPDKDIDVVLGGFPCQGFSLAGPRQVDDTRNVLYKYFVSTVSIKKPKVFVAENVLGIRTLGNGAVFEKIVEDFKELGYTLSATSVNAKDYGVPQDRVRVIIIGIRNDICNGYAYIFPQGRIDSIVTLREAFKDLPPVDMEDVCTAPYSSRYMSRNRKRGFDDVSFTIPAMAKQVPLSPDSDGMQYKDVDLFEFVGNYNRRMSYKEAAAVQTFPAGMYFHGTLDSKYKQIGNAVPVKLAEVIAENVNVILDGGPKLNENLRSNNPELELYADNRISQQVVNGKAFEYAAAYAIHKVLRDNGWSKDKVEIQHDKNFENTRRAYESVAYDEDETENDFRVESSSLEENYFMRAARAGAYYLFTVEPIMQATNDNYVVINTMPDSAGKKGDVRDLVVSFYDDKNHQKLVNSIGISCKNNHEAIKHPRLTEEPDFANEWTKKFSCSEEFMASIQEVYQRIDEYAGIYDGWSSVGKELKTETIYYPIITAFSKELLRLGKMDPSAPIQEQQRAKEFTRLLFEYMFGTIDFYKIIKDDKAKATRIYPYNLHSKLMRRYKTIVNNQAVKTISMPSEIVEVRIKPNSKTTIELFFDQWILSMRLHNADRKITRTSLKFDMQIKAQPRKVVANTVIWQ